MRTEETWCCEVPRSGGLPGWDSGERTADRGNGRAGVYEAAPAPRFPLSASRSPLSASRATGARLRADSHPPHLRNRPAGLRALRTQRHLDPRQRQGDRPALRLRPVRLRPEELLPAVCPGEDVVFHGGGFAPPE